MKRVRTQSEGDDRGQYLPMSKKRDDQHSLSLPLDLIIEILLKLPPRSVSKLILVSKLWSSIIKGKDFTDLYLKQSSTRPRLLFPFYRSGDDQYVFFHSASQENPSSDHRANTSPILDRTEYDEILPPVRSLLCYQKNSSLVICNPSTGQILTLPKVNSRKVWYRFEFFGYDPANDVYKVLFMTLDQPRLVTTDHQVFTLGAQKTTEWRMIECKHPNHLPRTQGLCRNGVMYYVALTNISGGDEEPRSLLVSFDLRFEEFSLIALPENVQIKDLFELVNYNGKIALVDQSFDDGKFGFWVLEDVSKQEWSKISVLIPSWNDLAREGRLYHCIGTISTGELVFSPLITGTMFFVLYYDPKEDKARRVEFQIKNPSSTAFLDHVESPMFLPRNSIADD